MATLLWDASGIAKAYSNETGAEIVRALFVQAAPFAVTYITYSETANILRRYRNRGGLTQREFAAARNDLETRFINGSNVTLLSLADRIFIDSIPFADAHNLNTTDAALLLAYTAYAAAVPGQPILVCADLRFLRAAQSEGLTCLNPETITATDALALAAS